MIIIDLILLLFVSIGEGERTIVEIAKATSLDDFSKIKGIYIIDKRNAINDLDTTPFQLGIYYLKKQ